MYLSSLVIGFWSIVFLVVCVCVARPSTGLSP